MHDTSFALGLAIGRKMGGGSTGFDPLALSGNGSLADIWTIPRYDDGTTEPTSQARADIETQRITYVSDILNRVYGMRTYMWAQASGNGDIDLYLSLTNIASDAAKVSSKSAAHDTAWYKAESYLLVSNSAILILYDDTDNPSPTILCGWFENVTKTGSYINNWEPFSDPIDWGKIRTPGVMLDNFGSMSIQRQPPNYNPATNQYSRYLRKSISTPDAAAFRIKIGTTYKFDISGSWAAIGQTITTAAGTLMYVGGVSYTPDGGQWEDITYWIRLNRLDTINNKNEQAPTPHWCGIYASKLCTYPHGKDDSDPTPGTYGDGYQTGHDTGYDTGYTAGEQAGQSAGYESGHAAGLEEGKEIGYQEGHAAGYKAGYDVGYQEGYDKGKADGYAEGEQAGHDAGYQEGHTAGYTEGHDAGYADGYAQGKTDGYNDGYAQGKIDGHEAGYQEGHDDGYQAGYDDGVAAGSGGDQEPQPSPDGYTHIVIDVGPIDRDFKLLMSLSGPDQFMGSLSVDWGDGDTSLETADAGTTRDITLTHTYQRAGSYDVTIKANDVTIVLGHGTSSTGLIGQSSSTSTICPIIVRSIVIGTGVTAIDAYALQNMRSMTSIYVADGVEIRNYAMQYCYALTHIRLPADLLQIPQYCLRGCASLKDITLPDTITTIGKYAFAECRSLESLVLPPSVQSMADYMCDYAVSLRSITLSPNAIRLPYYMLRYAYALEYVEIPENVNYIQNYAFQNAYGMRWLRMRPTKPPGTLSSTFSGFTAGCKIIVPDGCGTAYKSAARWSSYAERIFEESEVSW